MLEVSCLGGKTSEMVASSTYLCTGQPVDKSLINTKNDRGPSHEPYGIALLSSFQEDYELVSTDSLLTIW